MNIWIIKNKNSYDGCFCHSMNSNGWLWLFTFTITEINHMYSKEVITYKMVIVFFSKWIASYGFEGFLYQGKTKICCIIIFLH